MGYLQACVLGLVQGLGEFLPISSSGHLALAPWLLGWRDQGLTFDLALHLGTLAAVVAYFWRDWLVMFRGAAMQPGGKEARLLWLLVLAALPAAGIGLALDKWADQALRSPLLIGSLLVVFGLLLEAADRAGRRYRSLDDLSWAGALIIGLAQALALAPGVSRSGVTLTAGLMLGLTREAAARFSFLLSTPIIFGAAVFKLRHLHGADLTGPFIAGVAVSAISGMLAVRYFLKHIKTDGLLPYTIYRVVVGSLVVLLYLSRR